MKEKSLCSISDQSGAALVISILAILLIGVLAVAFMSTGTTSQEISQNGFEQTQAFFISEAGLTHGTKLVMAATTSQYSSILQSGSNPTPGTGDELESRGIPAAGLAFGNGRYVVSVFNDSTEGETNGTDNNQQVVIRSVGTGPDGASVTTEAHLATSSSPAILVNGRLLINGDLKVLGSSGSVHANGALTVSGNPCVQGAASSSSSVTVGGSLRNGSCTTSPPATSLANQEIMTPPTWDIRNDFRHKADYVMGIDGIIRNAAGTVVHNSSTNGNDWDLGGGGKWTWDPGNQKWIHGGGVMPTDKTWYSAGNLELASDFGLSSTIKGTFVAEGSILVSANPKVQGYLESGKYAFMAGKDLAISGNPTSGYSSTGIHYAGDQIKFNGNPKINGVVIAANLTDTNSPGGIGNPVPLSSGRMEISGNPEVTYDGGLIAGSVRVLSWREIRF